MSLRLVEASFWIALGLLSGTCTVGFGGVDGESRVGVGSARVGLHVLVGRRAVLDRERMVQGLQHARGYRFRAGQRHYACPHGGILYPLCADMAKWA